MNLDEILGTSDIVSLFQLKQRLESNHTVNIINYDLEKGKIVFSFTYNNQTYFFKYDSFIDPLKELIAQGIYESLKIPCVSYDLASVGTFHGNISLDFKKEGAKYISGKELLEDCFRVSDVAFYNNLESLWEALEFRYKNYPDRQQIVQDLMEKIIKCFLVDILTCQTDRNASNYGIVEYSDGSVDLAPVFDNSSLFARFKDLNLSMSVEFFDNPNYVAVIDHFLKVSSKEFTSILEEFLWVISKDNILAILSSIERKIGRKLLDSQKENYLLTFSEIKDFLESKLYHKGAKRS